jgi:hypothetical protein
MALVLIRMRLVSEEEHKRFLDFLREILRNRDFHSSSSFQTPAGLKKIRAHL